MSAAEILARARGSSATATDQENIPTTQPIRTEKRGVAGAGLPLQQMQATNLKRTTSADDTTDVLSPKKRARRSLIPGRSILRKSLSGSHAVAEDTTLNFTANLFYETLDNTEDRRKSFARRVSFAPTAHMREFSKADHEEASSEGDASLAELEPITSDRRTSKRQSSLARFDAMLAGREELSMEMADASVTTAFTLAGFAPSTDGNGNGGRLMDETQPDFGDESAMDIASEDVTAAFAVNDALAARSSLISSLARPVIEAQSDREGAAPSMPLVPTMNAGPPPSPTTKVEVIEYNVPLGGPGNGPPSGSSDAMINSSDAEDNEEGEGEASHNITVDMSLDAGPTGLIMTDGITSRRLSISGAIRRASLAPGYVALALLEAEDEEHETRMLEDDDDASDTKTLSARAPTTPASGMQQLFPGHSSRIPLSTGRERAPLGPNAPLPHAANRNEASGANVAVQFDQGQHSGVARARPQTAVRPTLQSDGAPGTLQRRVLASLDDFLETLDVQFMESVFSNPKRKSMGAAFGIDQTSSIALKTRVDLKEQIVAAIVLLPTLDTYNGMTRELRSSLQEAHTFLQTVGDGIACGDIPPLFVEYDAATTSQQDTIKAHLKASKALFRSEVRAEWYDYRIQCLSRKGGFIEGLQENLRRLEADRVNVGRAGNDFMSLVPELAAREQTLLEHLVEERSRQIALQNCDQEHLSSLREAVAEQAAQLDEQIREQKEVEQELARVSAKLADLEHRKSEASGRITKAKSITSSVRHFTPSEAQRLRQDLCSLQELQGWSIEEFNETEIKLLFCDELAVILTLSAEGSAAIEMAFSAGRRHIRDDLGKHIQNFFLERIKADLRGAPIPQRQPMYLLRRLANQWAAARRLVGEFQLLQSRYPLALSSITKRCSDETALRLSTRIFSRRARAAFDVRFELMGEEILSGDPITAVEAIGCNVEPRFGSIDRGELAYTVRERIAKGGPAALLMAAQAAEEKYS